MVIQLIMLVNKVFELLMLLSRNAVIVYVQGVLVVSMFVMIMIQQLLLQRMIVVNV